MRPLAQRSLLAILLLGAAAGAQAAEDTSLSFAFASQAGSGIYSIEGRVVQIYRLPIRFRLRRLEDDRVWGASMTLPATVGFYDFKAADVLEGEFPTHVGTASLLPGVEFNLRATRNWIVSPHVDAGAAKDFSGGLLVWVYDAGVRSVVSFPTGSWDGRAGQELLWAGAAEQGTPLADWYAEAQAGFEFRRELPWSSGRSRWDIGVFVLHEHFFVSEDDAAVAVTYAAPTATTTAAVDEQTQIGFSFGTRPKLAWKWLSLPKLGLSYQFGDGIWGVRLVIGEIF
jgi:hypothetical protein